MTYRPPQIPLSHPQMDTKMDTYYHEETARMQEMFNKVYLGLKSQGFQQSLNPEKGCMYRGEQGMKCAAGWLIPDESYLPSFEHRAASGLPVFCNLTSREGHLISQLQATLDSADNPAKMEVRLQAVADANGLVVPSRPR